MDKILILQLASILQSIAICFLCICVINLRKMLCRFIEDEILITKVNHYLDEPFAIVNTKPQFDDLGIKPIKK